MNKKSGTSGLVIARIMALTSCVALAACAGSKSDNAYYDVATPTVDYVESLDVYSAPHQDSFLNQLAMNYRSYAIYNARTSGYPELGELFAQKAVAAFSGELPFPETLNNWQIGDEQTAFELHTAYNELLDELKNDASDINPELAAEAQAKFDCWVSATASGQTATAQQCQARFQRALTALRDCKGGKVVNKRTRKTTTVTEQVTNGEMAVAVEEKRSSAGNYYPDTRNMNAMNGAGRNRDGVIIVNNVNIPEHLINPVPVQPMVFNQNIYGGDKTVTNSNNNNGNDSSSREYADVVGEPAGAAPVVNQSATTAVAPATTVQPEIPMIGEELVTREEFINMMMAMRAELSAINARLDKLQAAAGEKTMIKVQQIPLEPKQHVMEEIFEIRFDFNQATIKP
ncbi:MAG: hypothetical protein K2L94_00355, partial [Alphaproteobacteria bacterium]|nr:hypothetical protein [Alphaproteobacteria bacterium]